MKKDDLQGKIRDAQAAVEGIDEKFQLEAFKIILERLLALNNAQASTKVKSTVKTDSSDQKISSFSGPSKHIYSLILEGFLDKPKLLKEIIVELERRGAYYDMRRIDNSLREVFLKNKKMLTRIKQGNRWVYVIKK